MPTLLKMISYLMKEASLPRVILVINSALGTDLRSNSVSLGLFMAIFLDRIICFHRVTSMFSRQLYLDGFLDLRDDLVLDAGLA